MGRIAGAFYLITFVAGIYAFAARSSVANFVAMTAYVVVVLLFFAIFRPVSNTVSIFAAFFGLAGCFVSAANIFGVRTGINALVFFGFYCLLIGYLVYASGFLPRMVGVLMAIGGLSWLTFASAALARSLAPFNFLPGMIGEGVLTLWLLIFGTARRAAVPSSPL